jgi:hypothetical protein
MASLLAIMEGSTNISFTSLRCLVVVISFVSIQFVHQST